MTSTREVELLWPGSSQDGRRMQIESTATQLVTVRRADLWQALEADTFPDVLDQVRFGPTGRTTEDGAEVWATP